MTKLTGEFSITITAEEDKEKHTLVNQKWKDPSQKFPIPVQQVRAEDYKIEQTIEDPGRP
jgi:hypothetical protein